MGGSGDGSDPIVPAVALHLALEHSHGLSSNRSSSQSFDKFLVILFSFILACFFYIVKEKKRTEHCWFFSFPKFFLATKRILY